MGESLISSCILNSLVFKAFRNFTPKFPSRRVKFVGKFPTICGGLTNCSSTYGCRPRGRMRGVPHFLSNGCDTLQVSPIRSPTLELPLRGRNLKVILFGPLLNFHEAEGYAALDL